jgi:universal stress protein E
VARPPEKLLVGLDQVHDGSFLIRRAGELAHRFDASVVLFDCVHNRFVSRRYFPEEPTLAHARETLVRQHGERMRRLAAKLVGEGVEVSVDAAWDGTLNDGVIKAASRHQADWILVSVRLHPVHRTPMFSEADWQLIRHAPCPLLFVQPRPWSSPVRVVAAVDPLQAHGKPGGLDRRILEAGACICRHGGGHLHVFHAFTPILRTATAEVPGPLPVEYAEATLEGTHNAAVEDLVGDFPEAAGRVRVAEGRAEDKLPDYAAEVRADVVVMGAVARSPLKRMFIGSTAEKVLDRLGCDVMVIKPEQSAVHVARLAPPLLTSNRLH